MPDVPASTFCPESFIVPVFNGQPKGCSFFTEADDRENTYACG